VPAGNGASPRLNQIAGVVQFVVTATPDATGTRDGSFMTLHFSACAESGARVTLQMGLVSPAAPACRRPASSR